MIVLKKEYNTKTINYNDLPTGTLFTFSDEGDNTIPMERRCVYMKVENMVGKRDGKTVTAFNLSCSTTSVVSPEDYKGIEVLTFEDVEWE